MARTARIAATMTRSDRKRRFTYRVSGVGGCRVYRIGLHYRHGRVAIRGIVGKVSERRTIPF
jgi:hypothetical protein